MEKQKSEALFSKARKYFPGGVNSPVRAFRSVGGTPLFIERGDGCLIWDADGNEFIDFCGSWGPLILGHNHPTVRNEIIEAVKHGTSYGAPTRKENELAELILSNNPYIERLRFVSSGTEAVMSAIRLARGASGKTKILKFEGCYHGHVDAMLVKAGSGLSTFGTSSSAGVPESVAKDTLVIPLNDRVALEKVLESEADFAAVIIEPVPANNGLLLQDKEYLQFLRKRTEEKNILLIFDEVISGFRIGFRGAAGYYNIRPDIITYGKIIGGGMPVGAYGASAELMQHISPEGNVYQAGTLSGNPVAMAAGAAQLRECLKENFYTELEEKTKYFQDEIFSKLPSARELPFRFYSIGSVFWFAFTDREKIQAAIDIDPRGMDLFKIFHAELLKRGVYLGPSGYEVGFISAAHTKEQLKTAAEKVSEALHVVFQKVEV